MNLSAVCEQVTRDTGRQTVQETTLCYIEQDNRYLMLHRVKKKNDLNHDKWIGIGGKSEQGESPEECMRREIREETGLEVMKYSYRAIVTFVSKDNGAIRDAEYMHLFHIHEFKGELKECDEGDLEWVPVDTLSKLPHWKGDVIFLSLLRTDIPFFSLKLTYDGERLTQALLDEKPVLITERLILRPWLESDAESLFSLASDPEIGIIAGWQPHKSVEDSRKIIKDVLSCRESYAVVRNDTGNAIGSIRLMIRTKDGDMGQETGEIGYWLGRPFWGSGYIPEAVRELMRRGFDDFHCSSICICYSDGNTGSECVAEKCGFHYDHTFKDAEMKLIHKNVTEHCMIMTAEEYRNSGGSGSRS